MSRSSMKVMLVVFFDRQGVIHHEFIPRGQTVNKEFYIAVLKHLREAVRWKRPVVDEPELGVAPRQCTSSLIVPCAQLSGKK